MSERVECPCCGGKGTIDPDDPTSAGRLRLFSAAPAMVKALEKALRWCAGRGEYSRRRDSIMALAEDVAPTMDDALAKARGGAR